jgi:uncharacterized SAM-binding protein YcdF (DUF218 family)
MKGPGPIQYLKKLNEKKGEKIKGKDYSALRLVKRLFIAFGFVFVTMIILAFTDYPFYAYADLGTVESNYTESPEIIILLGGEGMPSADGLMRCYTAAEKALFYPEAEIIIALPENKLTDEPLLDSKLMANELTMRGIDRTRISFETKGTNTHEQALSIMAKIESSKRLLIVTAPEHMTRAAACFKKEGFQFVGGSPAFEHDLHPESLKEEKESFSPSLTYRYNLWSYLQYEIRVAREYVALAYYKLRGWI